MIIALWTLAAIWTICGLITIASSKSNKGVALAGSTVIVAATVTVLVMAATQGVTP